MEVEEKLMVPFGIHPVFLLMVVMVFLALVIVGILGLVFWTVRSFLVNNRNTESAREILDRRYAKGEIDQEEYEKRRQAFS